MRPEREGERETMPRGLLLKDLVRIRWRPSKARDEGRTLFAHGEERAEESAERARHMAPLFQLE